MATKSLHIRDVPEGLHETLRRRAADRGMSLRRYTVEVLESHCSMPTVDEWLDGLDALTPAGPGISGARAVDEARAEADAEFFAARRP